MSNVAVSSNSVDQLDTIGFHQVTIPFLPAFQFFVRQIILTSKSKEVRFTIKSVEAVQELTIKSSNGDILDVRKQEKADNLLNVLVTLQNADIFSNDVSNLHLLFVSTLTNQTEKISVQIKLYGTLVQLPSQILYSPSLLRPGTLVITTLVSAFAVYLLETKPLKDSSGSFMNSSSSSPKSHGRSKFYVIINWLL